MPFSRNAWMTLAASGRMGSARPSSPTKTPSTATHRGEAARRFNLVQALLGVRVKADTLRFQEAAAADHDLRIADVCDHALADLVVEVGALRNGQSFIAGGLDDGLGNRMGQVALGGRGQRHDLVQVIRPG